MMTTYLKAYTRGEPKCVIGNPSIEQVIEYINHLDGAIHTNLELIGSQGNLFIYSSQENRLHIAYSGIGPVNAYLIDKTQLETRMLSFQLENGSIDDWSMRETVSRDVAKEVASYFVQYSRLPEGLNWEGNMSDFDNFKE